MKFNRKGISTTTLAAVFVVVIIVVGGAAYFVGTSAAKTTTTTSTAVSTTLSTLTSTSVTTSVSTATSTSVTTSVSTTTYTTPTPTLPTTLAAGTLTESGSSLLYPLFNAWVTNFTAAYSNVHVNTASTGSGTGVTDAGTNVVNIGASDPYLTAAQSASYPGLLNIPVAVSSQAVNYNLPGIPTTTHLNLTAAVIAGIYAGTITTWNNAAIQSLNPTINLPSATIIPIHRSDSSGDTNLFTTFLTDAAASVWTYGAANTISWPTVPSAEAASGNSGMLSTCNTTPDCIAYIGVSYQASATSDGLGQAALQNAAGDFVTLNPTSVGAAVTAGAVNVPPSEKVSLIWTTASAAYPIVNFEYAIVQQAQSSTTLQQQIQTFLWWATLPTGGQEPYYLNSAATGSLGFLPLPTAIAQLSWAQIDSITG